jgi:hypothetical protein
MIKIINRGLEVEDKVLSQIMKVFIPSKIKKKNKLLIKRLIITKLNIILLIEVTILISKFKKSYNNKIEIEVHTLIKKLDKKLLIK